MEKKTRSLKLKPAIIILLAICSLAIWEFTPHLIWLAKTILVIEAITLIFIYFPTMLFLFIMVKTLDITNNIAESLKLTLYKAKGRTMLQRIWGNIVYIFTSLLYFLIIVYPVRGVITDKSYFISVLWSIVFTLQTISIIKLRQLLEIMQEEENIEGK